ncbi:MAG: EpsG family protein [Oscillospiraceae bacterium]|jgi:transmembrane protein EpsG|nr:EpsG family protein [Oscillospiraceae bacterium]
MLVYNLNLVGVTLFAYLADRYSVRSPLSPREGRRLPAAAFAVIVVLILTAVAGLRFDIGTDYINYCIIYSEVVDFGLSYSGLEGIEIGYLLLCKFLSYYTRQPFAMFFVCALITNVCVVAEARRSAVSLTVACLVYIFSALYMSTFNIVRQSLAVAIAFAGNRLLTERRMLPYLALIAFSMTVHTSMVIMIPVYFIVAKPAWSRTTVFMIIGTAVFFVLFGRFKDTLAFLSEGSRYSGIAEEKGGISLLRLAVTVPPLVPAFIWRKQLRERAPHYDCYVNMYLISCLILVVSMNSIYFSRFGIFFQFYGILLVPMYLKIGNRMKGAIITGAVLVFLAAYFFYQLILVNVDQANLLPYETLLSLPKDWGIVDRSMWH